MIHVFKTSVQNKRQALALKPHIDELLPQVRWNFDLSDCDRILRVETGEPVAGKVIDLLRHHNHSCEELD